MHTKILTATVVAALTVGAIPAAAYEAHGVPAFDRSTRTIYVGDDAYYLPMEKGTMKLAGADYIELTWVQEGDRRVVKSYHTERDDDDN